MVDKHPIDLIKLLKQVEKTLEVNEHLPPKELAPIVTNTVLRGVLKEVGILKREEE